MVLFIEFGTVFREKIRKPIDSVICVEFMQWSFEKKLPDYKKMADSLRNNIKLLLVFSLFSVAILLSKYGPDIKIPNMDILIPKRFALAILFFGLLWIWIEFGFLLNQTIYARLSLVEIYKVIADISNSRELHQTVSIQSTLGDSGITDAWFIAYEGDLPFDKTGFSLVEIYKVIADISNSRELHQTVSIQSTLGDSGITDAWFIAYEGDLPFDKTGFSEIARIFIKIILCLVGGVYGISHGIMIGLIMRFFDFKVNRTSQSKELIFTWGCWFSIVICTVVLASSHLLFHIGGGHNAPSFQVTIVVSMVVTFGVIGVLSKNQTLEGESNQPTSANKTVQSNTVPPPVVPPSGDPV